MIDSKAAEAHAAQIRRVFGRLAIVESDARTLRRVERENGAKAEALEVEAAALLKRGNDLVTKGPCGCSEGAHGAHAPAAAPASSAETVKSEAAARRPGTTETRRSIAHVHGLRGAFGRALASQGVTTLEQLAAKTEAELRAPLGDPAGKFADGFVQAARTALKARGLDLAPPVVVEAEPAALAPADEAEVAKDAPA